ncbi:PaaI family thioesterase [Citricoccus parietis]|uniref:PaaI family thioesterase n=2 Tax=Citricoccus parietis TaxID=592307 RepID=A0ABV6F286_9MICC
MAPGPWSREQDGRFAAGVLGVLADNVLAQAVLAHRHPDMWAVTTELAFDFFAPPVEGQKLTASATVLVVDAGGGGSRGRIIDESGGAVADVTFWGRFVEGVPQAVVDQHRAPSLEVRPGSLAELLGLERDGDQMVLRERSELVNPLGMMHGGVLVPTLEQAAVELGARPEGMVTASMRINYLRPASGDILVAVRQIHRGRTFASAEATALRPDGKMAAWALLTFRSTGR